MNIFESSINRKRTFITALRLSLKRTFKRNWDLYVLILPVVIYFIVFHYGPMYGVQISFKDYIPSKGIWGSSWVGLKHFERFFNSYYFNRLIFNTISISVYSLVIGFPAPIILAIMLNEVKSLPFKKTVQMVTYAPHFLSTVVLCGMILSFFSLQSGVINVIIKSFGGKPVAFMNRPEWFKSIYVFSGAWQNMGWNSIVYIATLSGIDPSMQEAAVVDGANKWQRLLYVIIPCLIPTAIILLILNMGRIMNVGFEKIFLLQNDLNLSASDVIATYVYRMGIQGTDFSFSAAVGLFNSVINFLLLITVNKISKRASSISLW